MTNATRLALSALLLFSVFTFEAQAIRRACNEVFVSDAEALANPIPPVVPPAVTPNSLIPAIRDSVVQITRINTHLIGKIVYVHVRLSSGETGYLRGEVLAETSFEPGQHTLVIREQRRQIIVSINLAEARNPAIYLVPTSAQTLFALSAEERRGLNLDAILSPRKFDHSDNLKIRILQARIRQIRAQSARAKRTDVVRAELRATFLERKLEQSVDAANYQTAKQIIRHIYPRVWNAVIQLRQHRDAINSSFEMEGSAFIQQHRQGLRAAQTELQKYGPDFLTTDIHLSRRLNQQATPAAFKRSLRQILNEVLEEFPGDNNIIPTRDEIIYLLTTDSTMVIDRLRLELKAERRAAWRTFLASMWLKMGFSNDVTQGVLYKHRLLKPFQGFIISIQKGMTDRSQIQAYGSDLIRLRELALADHSYNRTLVADHQSGLQNIAITARDEQLLQLLRTKLAGAGTDDMLVTLYRVVDPTLEALRMRFKKIAEVRGDQEFLARIEKANIAVQALGYLNLVPQASAFYQDAGNMVGQTIWAGVVGTATLAVMNYFGFADGFPEQFAFFQPLIDWLQQIIPIFQGETVDPEVADAATAALSGIESNGWAATNGALDRAFGEIPWDAPVFYRDGEAFPAFLE